MSTPLTLRPHGPLPADLDASPLRPGLTRAQIESMLLRAADVELPAGEWFSVHGEDTAHLVFEEDCRALRRLGAGMTAGRITIAGDAGDELGFEMRDGTIRVQGRAGHHAGTRMRGGVIDIDGDCGDFAGGALTGSRQGMAGGILHIHGRAGDRAGDGMRRGVLIAESGTGDYLGSRMLAGTVIAGGVIGAHPGFGLKRGTLLLLSPPSTMPVWFNDCGVQEFGFLTLLARALAERFTLPERPLWRRWSGDLAEGGYGEMLLPA